MKHTTHPSELDILIEMRSWPQPESFSNTSEFLLSLSQNVSAQKILEPQNILKLFEAQMDQALCFIFKLPLPFFEAFNQTPHIRPVLRELLFLTIARFKTNPPRALAILKALSYHTDFMKILCTSTNDRGQTPIWALLDSLFPYPTDLKPFYGALRILLTFNADPDASDEQGVTPLMIASRLLLPQCIATLLTFGADPHKKDLAQRTAFDFFKTSPYKLIRPSDYLLTERTLLDSHSIV